jgi:hypothetical protein
MKILLLLLLSSILSTNCIQLTLSTCPVSCICDLVSNVTLKISSCTQTQSTFTLPSDPVLLASVTSIIAQNCQIQSFPSNICQYSNLVSLDLSTNQIEKLTNLNLNCLKNLVDLNLGYNSIKSIESSTFNNLTSLLSLNLQFNKITQIPQGLFNRNLINLRSLNLSYNGLTTMELWPTYLSNIVIIDLKYNSIQRFTNDFGWYLETSSYLPALPLLSTIDLQYNNISLLDDRVIEQYGVCSFSNFTTFINKYFSIFWLNNNPIACNCTNSQRLLTDTQNLLKLNSNLTWSNLYQSRCGSPLNTRGILSFDNCALTIDYPYCINSPPPPSITTIMVKITTTKVQTEFNGNSAQSKKNYIFLILLMALNIIFN